MIETPFHLTNKKFFVTGASSGIGRQIAISISEMGGKLIITGRNKERLQDTFFQLKGEGHQMFTADLTNAEERERLLEDLTLVDGIVMNAGMVEAYPVKFLTSEKIKSTFGLNFESIVLIMANILRNKKLNAGGSIVFISSISSKFPPKGGSMYSSSKAALETFSKVIALENHNKKIRSNCISPGMVKTALYNEVERTVTKESMDAHIAHYPLGVGHPEDVANTTIFLLSDASRWITGTNIIVDGGCLLNG